MNNLKPNFNPPDGWVESLKQEDFVYNVFSERFSHRDDPLILKVKCVGKKDDQYYNVYFYDPPSSAGVCGSYLVDRDGYNCSKVYGSIRDLLPMVKSIPVDAGDGE